MLINHIFQCKFLESSCKYETFHDIVQKKTPPRSIKCKTVINRDHHNFRLLQKGGFSQVEYLSF